MRGNVITGETGAGKSIMLDALASPSAIAPTAAGSPGADKADILATFDLAVYP